MFVWKGGDFWGRVATQLVEVEKFWDGAFIELELSVIICLTVVNTALHCCTVVVELRLHSFATPLHRPDVQINQLKFYCTLDA